MSAKRGDRCDAAHRHDRRPCKGKPDAVIVYDRIGDSRTGCVLHAAALAAALGKRTRIALHNGTANAAIKAYQRIGQERADDFLTILAAMRRRLERVPDTTDLLTPGEVAALFRVNPTTVVRWAQAGRLRAIRTLGGHRRYRQDEVRTLLAATEETTPQSPAGTVPAVRRETT